MPRAANWLMAALTKRPTVASRRGVRSVMLNSLLSCRALRCHRIAGELHLRLRCAGSRRAGVKWSRPPSPRCRGWATGVVHRRPQEIFLVCFSRLSCESWWDWWKQSCIELTPTSRKARKVFIFGYLTFSQAAFEVFLFVVVQGCGDDNRWRSARDQFAEVNIQRRS